MSGNRVCYNPLKGVDDVIAQKMGTHYTPWRVATLRGIYDTANPGSPLDVSNPDIAAMKLANFNRQQIRNRQAKIKETFTHLAESYRRIKDDFSAEERFDRVNMIAYMFSLRVTAMQNGTPGVTRAQITNGYIDSQDLKRGGEFNIFEGVYRDIMTAYESKMATGDTESAQKLQKVLDNWPSLVTFARIRLRDTEGLILGAHDSYSAEVDPSNFADEDLSQIFQLEESKREGWQEVAAAISSFGSLGKDVRRFLSGIPVVDDSGNQVKDDLGIPKMLDPVKAHQSLLEILRGCTSKESMMSRLRTRATTAKWLNPIVAALETPAYNTWNGYSEEQRSAWNNIDQLKTKLFVDLKKNFQPYSIIFSKMVNGVKQIRTKILNLSDTDRAFTRYMNRVVFNKPLSDEAIFDNQGNISWDKVQQLRSLIAEYLPAPVDKSVPGNAFVGAKVYGLQRATKAQKLDFIVRVSRLLDIPMTTEAAEQLLHKRRDLNKFTRALSDLNFKILEKLMNGKTTLGDIKYKDFIAREIGTAPNNVSLKDRLTPLAALGVQYTEGSRLERACRYNGSRKRGTTYYSDVNPSYLGDEIDTIQEYVSAGDNTGLREYIRNKYLGTSFFSYDGKILNWWVRDLYEDGVGENSFAANFTSPDRLLGEDGNEFENFTSKAHAQALFTKYFAQRQLNRNNNDEPWRKDYAEYPIFILGDSGVAKFIRAKRYDSYDSTDKLLGGFYDVYKQERRRMALAEATAKKMNPWAVRQDGTLDWSKVTVKIENFTDNGGKYSYLPFLNSDYKDSKGKIEPKYSRMLSANPTESEVKNAISAYMKDAQQDFIDRLVEYGVVTRTETKDGKVNYYSPVLAPEMATGKTFEQVIQDYFWNTKFATVQQLQMFTIDPSFYKGTKDLQKRYKEIHAPGAKLDVDARWMGELVAGENPIERCVYFDDISVNAESVDTEFMNSILYNFAVADESTVAAAISRGITTPKEGAEETARIKELKSLLGDNWDIYKSYQKNTLTDGQGYRSLQSYRKVMIMAGKWNDNMENLYNELQSIRSKYGKNSTIPTDVMKKIASMAIVFMPIKPYMYTFENYALSGSDKLMIPVQHKYAEAVLIPELLPVGSKLRDMAYWMEEHTDENGQIAPIDLVCSTKVVKVGNFGATDIGNTNNATELSAALGNAYVHQLSYSDYRIQTNVPEHINGSQLFGTQVRKLIMANIGMNADYSRYTGGKVPKLFRNQATRVNKLNGRNLVQFYNALISANIVDSFETFNEAIKDNSALSDALLQSTISNSRESLDNMLAYALDDDGNFNIPLFEGGLEHDSAALVFSMFKRLVNKQKINGGSAVQVSAMGITGYEEDGGLRYVADPNNPKNILYAEAEVPFDLNYIDDNGQTVELQYDDWVNPDGTLKTDPNGTPLLEKEFPGILDIIAYRIPTERDYSMINVKVKRFSRKEAGGTIKVPPQGTTISGFDFDIDKLYFMRRQFKRKSYYRQEGFNSNELFDIFAEIYENHPEIKSALEQIRDDSGDYTYVTKHRKNGETYQAKEYDHNLNHYWDQMLEQNPSFVADPSYSKDALFTEAVASLMEQGKLDARDKTKQYYLDTYNYDKTPLENSRIARNNMLIDLIQQRLQDPETFKQRYTPGGFKNASNAARVLRELLFGDLSDITENGKVNFSRLYGRAAIKNADPEPNYDPSDPITIITYNQQNQVAGKLIGIFANQNTNHAFASLMTKMVVKPGMNFEFCGHNYNDFLHAPAGIDVDLNVAEFLAASVDAVKDPVLNFLNLNTLTADAGATLARLGYTTEEIGLLFNQPIIRDICEYAFNNNCQLDSAMRAVTNNYKGIADTAKYITNPGTDFSKDRLASNIVNDRKRRENKKQITSDEAIEQLKVAELFSKISTISRDLSEFVTNTKFTASNAAGSTFGDYYAQQLKVQDYVDRHVNSTDDETLAIEMEVSPTLSTPIMDDNGLLYLDKEDYVERLMDNPFAYEQAMFDMNRKALLAMKKYYPYETMAYVSMRSRMNDLVSYGHLDASTINTLHSDYMVFMLSQQEGSRFNGEAPGPDGTHTNREYYERVFPEQLFKFREAHPELAGLAIFQYLDISYDETTKLVSLNIQNIGGLKPYQKDELRDSWAELARDYPGVGLGLFMYNFYKLGFTFSPKAFMNIAPTEVKESISVGGVSYVEFLRKIQRGEVNVNIEDFAQQHILNHTENGKFVYTPFGEDLQTITKLAMDNRTPKAEFILDASNFGREANGFMINDPTLKNIKAVAFKPVIAIKYNLDDGSEAVAYYIASSEDDAGTGKFNVSGNKTMKYVFRQPLGITNSSLKYLSTSQRPTAAPVVAEAPIAEGRTDVIPEVSKEIQSMSDDAIIDELATEYLNALNRLGATDDMGQPYTVNDLKNMFRNMGERDDLEAQIAAVRAACRENGVMVLDAEGNPTIGC